MQRVSILLSVFAWMASAAPLVPLCTTPDSNAYVSFVTALLASAEGEVLVALSDVRLYAGGGATDGLLAALAEAAGRGVDVRVLVETRTAGPGPEQRAAFSYLERRGVRVRLDDPDVTLHARFIVVDRRWIVVGSTHWTASALVRSAQLDIAVEHKDLADAFVRFFDVLWDRQLRASPRLAPHPWPRPAAVPLLDLPRGGLHTQTIPGLIRGAAESVRVAVYRLSFYPVYPDSPSNRIVEELCRAAARGIDVRVLIEGGEDFADLAQDNRVSAAYLTACGVAVRIDPPHTTLHVRALVVDQRDVLVTSANWSYASLVHNVEAGVALLGVPELGRAVAGWLDSLWAEGRPVR